MLPLARAAVAAGHEVAVAPRPALVGMVEAAGFPAFATGDPALDPVPTRRPLRPIDPAAEDRVLVEGFAGVVARDRAPALVERIDRWRPDVVLCDEVDFGAMVAAECAGVPHASTVSMPAGTFVRRSLLAEALAALRAGQGLPPDPGPAMLDRHLVVVPAPPSFRDPSVPLPATARHLRPSDPEPGSVGWGPSSSGRPLVYASLGTAFNQEAGDLYARVVAGVRDLPVDLLVTVGRELDPAELGAQPENVRIERYVPQWVVLPHAAVAVTHGGSGGVVGALAHGVPVVALPLGADQPSNAARVEALGVGSVLDAVTATPDQVAGAVESMLADAGARDAAGRLRAECAALPALAEAVAWLEALADGHVMFRQTERRF
jgi:UDP:flavonoid glycosyltransferase YjiC (YdhE family)